MSAAQGHDFLTRARLECFGTLRLLMVLSLFVRK
jgi:hypothetical protein